jgi:hypothetical protein
MVVYSYPPGDSLAGHRDASLVCPDSTIVERFAKRGLSSGEGVAIRAP